MGFKLIDTNRFWLNSIPPKRFIHIASIQSNLREFIVMIDMVTQKSHIEEITGGTLRVIEDDILFDDLLKFVFEKGLVEIKAKAPIEEQPFHINKN